MWGQVAERYTAEQIDSFYADGTWTSDTLFDVVAAQADARPDVACFRDSTSQLTYSELRDRALDVAQGLTRLGVRRGDAVAVQLPNWSDFAPIVVGIARLGAVLVPVMPIFRRDECLHFLSTTRARVVFTAGRYKSFDHEAMHVSLKGDVPSLEHVVVVRDTAAAGAITLDELTAGPAVDLPPAAEADDPFACVFTSGTTSLPRGAVHTFNSMSAGARLLGRGWAYTSDDVQFGPSPVTHTTGLVTSVLLPFVHGASSYVMEAWEPFEGLRQIEKHRCTAAVTATTFLQMLIDAYDPQQHDASSLRFWCAAGSPIPASAVTAAREAVDGLQVLSLYGRTENITTTMCTLDDDPQRSLTSDGRALPGQEVKIVDFDGNEVTRGTEGDIAYRGAMNCLEYIGQPIETADMVMADGFSRSGDLGVMDACGYVRVTGRLKDIVIRGGLNISVRQVEDALSAHSSIQSVAVVGMPDPRLGERVCAYVMLKADAAPLTVDDLKTYLLNLDMAIQKVPERVEIVGEMPTTPTGKIQKHVLRADIASKLEAAS